MHWFVSVRRGAPARCTECALPFQGHFSLKYRAICADTRSVRIGSGSAKHDCAPRIEPIFDSGVWL